MNASERCKFWGFSLILLIPLLGPLGHRAGFHWLAAVVIFAGVPLLDRIIGEDRTNLHGVPAFGAAATSYLRALPALYILVWIFALLWTACTLVNVPLSLCAQAGLVFAASIASAFVPCVAHELLHTPTWPAQLLCRVALAVSWHGTFLLEHHHHHQTVGRTDIGGTPKLGESLWAYLPRTLAQGLSNANRMERSAKRHHSRHRILQQALYTAAIGLAFYAYAGVPALVLFCVQGAFAVFVVEAMTYIQHYGLGRVADQPVTAAHAWNRNGWLSNCLTLNMTRHSDHHLADHQPYFALRHRPAAPLLPADYFTLFMVAMVPAWWRHLMDHRVRAYQPR